MKQLKYAISGLLLLLVVSGNGWARDWEYQGRTVTGEFDRVRDGKVYLRQGNETVAVEISELSRQDQGFILSVTKERTWTNSSGKQIIASFVTRDAETVTILKDGKEFTIPIASLCVAHQNYLNKTHPWAGAGTSSDPFSAADLAATAAAERASPAAKAEDRDRAPAANQVQPDVRNWVTKFGKTMRGRFSKLGGNLVWFETASGEEALPLSFFNERDQALIRQLEASRVAESSRTDSSLPFTAERSWKKKNGETVQGRFLRLSGALVYFETESGEKPVPLAILTYEHQALVRQLEASKVADSSSLDSSPPSRDEPDTSTSETPSRVSTGDEWILRDGSSVTGKFEKIQGNLVWLVRNPGTTVLPLDKFTDADQHRIYAMSRGVALPTDDRLARTDAADDLEVPSAVETADIAYSGFGEGHGEAPTMAPTAATPQAAPSADAVASTRSMAMNPGDYNTDRYELENRINELRNSRSSTPASRPPGYDSGSDTSIRFRGGRGLVKLVVAVGILVCSGFIGLLKMMFGSGSRRQ